MEKNLNRDILTFVALVFGLSVIPFILIYMDGGTDSPWVMLLMWVPALAGIIGRLIRSQSPFKGIGWNPLKSFKWVLLAMIVPLLVFAFYASIIFALGIAEYDPEFVIRDGSDISVRGVAMIFGAAPQNVFMFIGNFLLSFFIGNLIYMLTFALGEEYGWRGHLQPLITERFGLKKGLLFLGLIWGFWHLPGILMGHNFPEYRFLGGLVLMPLACIGMSLAFGKSYLRSGNIWVPVMFHSAFNLVPSMSSALIKEGTKAELPADIVFIGLWVVVGLLCWRFISIGPVHEESESAPAT